LKTSWTNPSLVAARLLALAATRAASTASAEDAAGGKRCRSSWAVWRGPACLISTSEPARRETRT
jgi:hypothetical protein